MSSLPERQNHHLQACYHPRSHRPPWSNKHVRRGYCNDKPPSGDVILVGRRPESPVIHHPCEEAQRRQREPDLPSRTSGLLPSHPATFLQKKASWMSDLISKGYPDSNGHGKSGDTTSKTHRRRSIASSATPTPPQIPLDPQMGPRTSMESIKTETPYGQQ